ncbi:hypothetical protein [Spiroplasma ixodetis]|uniref:Uncharacterized protein n=1 Tax=Spiroplasma ixodetis TaxID=2141 RepID=A0ABM8BTD1_9MOLU|nr:hypothetical protein [Spiroplasma ixodetis]BDT03121.1 hypothetical protein SHM_07670 [Spiroplasma ixodetis]
MWGEVRNLIDNKQKRKFRHRTVSISLGFDLEKSTDNRHVLENKYIFVISTRKGQRITKKEFGKSIITNLDNIFIGYTNENLKLTGDGATYLKSTANYLKIDYAVDKWHPLQKLKQVFIVGKGKRTKENNKKLNYAYYKLFLNGNYYKLLDYLKGKIVKVSATKLFFYSNIRLVKDNLVFFWVFGLKTI